MNKTLVPVERVQKAILFIRAEKVILDADWAALYGVSTKRLNEQVKRNRGRFPDDFMFQLTSEEKADVVANCDHLKRLKFSPKLPYAFSEHGTIMAANVQGETSSSIVVNLIDSNNQSYDVAAEDVRPVPNFNFTQVIFRLPDNLSVGPCTIKLKAHGQVSNSGTIRIRT